MVCPTFFNLSLNLAIRSSWSEAQSAPDFVLDDCIELLHLWLQKNIINLISVLTIWWCPCVECSLVLLEEGVCYDQCVLLAILYCLCPASFCTPRPNLPVTPGISKLPAFAFQSPIMKRTSLLGLSSGRSCRSHSTVQLQLLQYYWSAHRLGLLWYWMVCLGNVQRSFCHCWDCIQVLHFRLFCWLWWLLHFF